MAPDTNPHGGPAYPSFIPLGICAAVTLLDQWSKYWIRSHFSYSEHREVIPGLFDLTYVRNPGAAWGMLGGHTGLLTLISLAMLLLLIIFRKAVFGEGRLARWVFGLLLGGIVGNLMDRIKHGAVTDFLDFHLAGHVWPTFNVADTAICVGVGLYILGTWQAARKEAAAALPED